MYLNYKALLIKIFLVSDTLLMTDNDTYNNIVHMYIWQNLDVYTLKRYLKKKTCAMW